MLRKEKRNSTSSRQIQSQTSRNWIFFGRGKVWIYGGKKKIFQRSPCWKKETPMPLKGKMHQEKILQLLCFRPISRDTGGWI